MIACESDKDIKIVTNHPYFSHIYKLTTIDGPIMNQYHTNPSSTRVCIINFNNTYVTKIGFFMTLSEVVQI